MKVLDGILMMILPVAAGSERSRPLSGGRSVNVEGAWELSEGKHRDGKDMSPSYRRNLSFRARVGLVDRLASHETRRLDSMHPAGV